MREGTFYQNKIIESRFFFQIQAHIFQFFKCLCCKNSLPTNFPAFFSTAQHQIPRLTLIL